MGCDIHLHIELKHADGRWLHYASPMIDRWYKLFSIMAGVRNGCELKPISEPKGFPEDASEITKAIWASSGDHTPSWLSSAEVLKLEEWLKNENENEKTEPKSFLKYNLEHTIMRTYLDGNSFCAFLKWDDCEYMPKPFVDFRFVFWFDS